MRILRMTCYGAFGIVLVLAGVVFLSPQLPYLGSVEVKIVKSGSMQPAIKTGGIVVLTKSDRYVLGDIVTFDSANSQIPTTHRIVGLQGEGESLSFVTKGDANEDPDTDLAQASKIHGKVLFSLPYVGFILDFARKPLGFSLLIALPALLIIFDELEKIWNEFRKLRRGKIEENGENTLPTLQTIPHDSPKNTNVHSTTLTRSVALDVRTPLVRPQRRIMDIRPPVQKVISRNTTIIPVQKRSATNVRGVAMTACAVFILNALILSSATIGSTSSYFNDTETSLANRLVASAIDFVVQTDGDDYGFVEGILNEEGGAIVQVVTPEKGSAGLRYELDVEFATGTPAFCAAIHADVTEPFDYHGSLSTLFADDVAFGSPWSLGLSLIPTEYEIGTVCTINFVYRAYDIDANGNTGYVDEEKVPLTLTVLSPDIALPEQFLRTAQVEGGAPSDIVEIFIPTGVGTSTDTGTTTSDTEDEDSGDVDDTDTGDQENEQGAQSDESASPTEVETSEESVENPGEENDEGADTDEVEPPPELEEDTDSEEDGQ